MNRHTNQLLTWRARDILDAPHSERLMILVVGATGLLGGEICQQLAAAGHSVRALVRPTANESRVENLRRLGAELVTGDLKDPASLDKACAGADVVITTA